MRLLHEGTMSFGSLLDILVVNCIDYFLFSCYGSGGPHLDHCWLIASWFLIKPQNNVDFLDGTPSFFGLRI